MVLTPTVTICTDASVNAGKQIAAWAAYIRLPDKTIKTGGIIKQQLTQSTHAEMRGMANALFIADKSIDLTKYRLIIYCDNINALGEIVVSKRRYKKGGKRNKLFFDENIRPFLLKAQSFEPRYVKGHLPMRKWDSNSKRHYMQRWCDKYAHKLMQQATK